jgi:hypothetical protein
MDGTPTDRAGQWVAIAAHARAEPRLSEHRRSRVSAPHGARISRLDRTCCDAATVIRSTERRITCNATPRMARQAKASSAPYVVRARIRRITRVVTARRSRGVTLARHAGCSRRPS